MIEFRKIDENNYLECISLKINENQLDFVADNARSLLDAVYLEGLKTLGIYNDHTMVGFLLYDYDQELQGWSLSRFMIDLKYQGNGYGTASLKAFLDLFKNEIGPEKLYACVNVNNIGTIKLFKKFGFDGTEEIQYTSSGKVFRELKLQKQYFE